MTLTTSTELKPSLPSLSQLKSLEAEGPRDWLAEVETLEKEWADIRTNPHNSIVTYYRFFERVRELKSEAHRYCGEGTIQEVVIRLDNLKSAVAPHITCA